MVGVPDEFWLYVIEQLPPESVQVFTPESKVPPPFEDQLTVPVGVLVEPALVSLTVTVQVVVSPELIGFGTQTTLVLVERFVTVRLAVPLLVLWVELPPY